MSALGLCECCDPGCEAHVGKSGCNRTARHSLIRIDMADDSPLYFCGPCAADAMESGVFGEGA